MIWTVRKWVMLVGVINLKLVPTEHLYINEKCQRYVLLKDSSSRCLSHLISQYQRQIHVLNKSFLIKWSNGTINYTNCLRSSRWEILRTDLAAGEHVTEERGEFIREGNGNIMLYKPRYHLYLSSHNLYCKQKITIFLWFSGYCCKTQFLFFNKKTVF